MFNDHFKRVWGYISSVVTISTAFVAGFSAFSDNISKLIPDDNKVIEIEWKFSPVHNSLRSAERMSLFIAADARKEGFFPVKDCIVEATLPDSFVISQSTNVRKEDTYSFGFRSSEKHIFSIMEFSKITMDNYLRKAQGGSAGPARARLHCPAASSEWSDVAIPGASKRISN